MGILIKSLELIDYRLHQYGGPDGEMAASLRYLSQRYSMNNRKVASLLTDIGVLVGKWYMVLNIKF